MPLDIDDEDKNVPYAYYSPEALQQDTVQNVWLVPHTATNTAPLQVNRQQVMLELIDASSTGERFGLDLVAVLDVSESMEFSGKHRLGKMKTAMQFVIKKLSPMDRLSIVTFSDVAKRLCPLRSVTQVSQAHLMGLVDGLTASGRTNIEDGLRTGHKVLTDRRIAGGRVASIFLLSDGNENEGHATNVDVSDVAVYTFGFGADYDPKVLDEIARKSKGGTFSFVRDEENMSEPFSQILGGLLSVVLQDLKLTVSPHPGDSTIENVNAGLYQQTSNANTGSVTVSFGDLFTTEVRRIIVDILLPVVHRKKKVTAISAYCTYSIQGKPFVSRELTVTISRTASVVPNVMKPEAMRTELARRRHANYLGEARTMADNEDLMSAKNKLVEAKNDLELEQTNTMIEILRTHLDKLLELTRFPGLRAYLRSLKTSHDRQRIAATGDVKGDRLFDTYITGIVRGEAEEFVKNPTMEVRPIGHDFTEAKKGRDQQGMERPPMMEARTWWWGDWKSHHESSRWAWAMVIMCMVLAVSLIVIGVTLFAVYLIYKPKMPHLVVSDVQLGVLQYAQQDGTIQYLQLPITILAENKNSKADATFSRVDLTLQFHGADVALLRTPAPFVVAPESSLPLLYIVVSAGLTLDPPGMQSMDESLSAGVVPFDLRGKARIRWKVGIFLKVHFWTRISCRLHFFFPGNCTVMPTDLHRCRSRSP